MTTIAACSIASWIGAAAALAATSLQLRQARQERAAAERARAAELLGRVRGILLDLNPQALADAGGRSATTMENIARRWWRERDNLLVFAAATRSAPIAGAATELAETVAAAWERGVLLNRALENGDDTDGALAQARAADQRARAAADELAAALRAA